jgi:hypothetical protein
MVRTNIVSFLFNFYLHFFNKAAIDCSFKDGFVLEFALKPERNGR